MVRSYANLVRKVLGETLSGMKERMDSRRYWEEMHLQMNIMLAIEDGTWTRILTGYYLPPPDDTWRAFIREADLDVPRHWEWPDLFKYGRGDVIYTCRDEAQR